MRVFTIKVKKTKGKHSKVKQKLTLHLIWKKIWYVYILLGALLASYLVTRAISHFTDSVLPAQFTLFAFPGVLSIGLYIFILWKCRFLWRAATATAVFSLLFTLLLINNYYRFFPTLGQVFNKNNVTKFDQTNQTVYLKFGSSKNGVNSGASLEQSITSVAEEPTKGTVLSLNIPGTISKFHPRGAFVYLPAFYNNSTHVSLPVIVLLPGYPGLPENWLGSGLQNTMDQFARHHYGITPIVFMVDDAGSLTNDTECVDSSRGNVETYLSVDVPKYIKSNFNVDMTPDHWAIGGLSMGGTCSIMIALRHQDVYHYFLDFGGESGPEVGSKEKTISELFAGSEYNWQQHQPGNLLSTHQYSGMGGFFGVGKEDERSVTNAAAQLSQQSQRAGIETVYEVLQGQHTFDVWQEAFQISLPWVSNRIGATECASACL